MTGKRPRFRARATASIASSSFSHWLPHRARATIIATFATATVTRPSCQFTIRISQRFPSRPTHTYYNCAAMSKPEQAADGAHPAAIAQPAPAPPKLDPVYYNWSNTFSIMMGRMTGDRDVELEKNYFTELDATKAESICKRCETNKDYLLKYSPIIRFLSDEVYKLGGDLNKDNILCRMCTNEQSGGFSLDYGILLCANKFRNRGHQEDTMAHEMVHAWDHLKWKVEANNLRHQACLEVCKIAGL